MDYNKDYSIYPKNTLPEKRFRHTLGVRDTAINLCIKYGVDPKKGEIASLLHDYTKYMDLSVQAEIIRNELGDEFFNKIKDSEAVYHGFSSSIISKNELGIDDLDIINAIRYHSTGRINMSTLEKIIYISDFIEPGRSFKEAEVARELANKDLDFCMLYILKETMGWIKEKGNAICIFSKEALEYYEGLING